MTRYLTLEELLELHKLLLFQSGGTGGVRDAGALASAVAQPSMAFGGNELYASLTQKAAALAFSLIQNHPFMDGNKRVGHAAMEVMLRLNGYEIKAHVDEQEQVVLSVASSEISRGDLARWLEQRLAQLG